MFLANFPSFQSKKSDFDLLTPSIFYDKTKYSSNPKPFTLCCNVNGVRLICRNWALGVNKHFESEMPTEVGVSLDSLTLGACYFRTDQP
jgi:hypothetical protein